MTRFPKIAQFAIMLAFACLMAGIYGVILHQVSYTLGADYFHNYKFVQFQMDTETPPRLGAAITGWKSSWWMGLVIGVPLLALALLARDAAAYGKLCRLGFLTVIVTTIVAGVATIVVTFAVLTPDNLPPRFTGQGDADWLGFARAGFLLEASFLGALLGLALAALRMMLSLIRARRTARGE